MSAHSTHGRCAISAHQHYHPASQIIVSRPHPLHITFHTPTHWSRPVHNLTSGMSAEHLTKSTLFLDSLGCGKTLRIFFTPKYAGFSLVMGVVPPLMPVHPQIWSILGVTCPVNARVRPAMPVCPRTLTLDLFHASISSPPHSNHMKHIYVPVSQLATFK